MSIAQRLFAPQVCQVLLKSNCAPADPDKVKALAESIAEIGLKEPVRQVALAALLSRPTQPQAKGCFLQTCRLMSWRLKARSTASQAATALRCEIICSCPEACTASIECIKLPLLISPDTRGMLWKAHQQLGAETIRCRVRKASQQTLKMHLM